MPAAGLPAPGDEARVDVGDHGYTKQRCEETAKRAEAFLARLADLPANASPHLPAVQVAALLLRMCGCGKITHMLRSNPPSTTREAARSFDATLLEAYTKLAELDPLTDAQAGQCQLPLNLGGRGLRSQERVAPAAWAASWAHCLPEVLRRSGVDELTDLETSALPLAAACKEAAAALPPPPRPEDSLCWRDLAQQGRPKLQKALSRRIDEKLHSGMLSALDASGRARLRSCGGPLAAGWQWASPASPAERLEDADYRATARALLGQPATAATSATCQNLARTGAGAGRRCGEAVCSHAHHAHRCAVGGGLVARSNDLEAVWAAIRRECGHTVARQVPVAGWDRWRWTCAACNSRGLA